MSRRQDYSGKLTERPRAILKEESGGLGYNHELLATIAIVEDTGLEKKIKAAYESDGCVARILKNPTGEFLKDYQGLIRFKGLVYILAALRRDFVREQHSLPAHEY